MQAYMQMGLYVGAVLGCIIFFISIIVEAICRYLPKDHNWHLRHVDPPIPICCGVLGGFMIMVVACCWTIILPLLIIIGILIVLGKYLAKNVVSKYAIVKIEENN